MIQASIEVILAGSQQQRFLSILRPLLEPTSCDAGCIRCEVWKSIADDRHFRFLTEWQSASDLDRYLKSGRFREVLIAAELSDEELVIEIHSISETRGFEYVMELLDSKDDVAKPRTDADHKDPKGSERRS